MITMPGFGPNLIANESFAKIGEGPGTVHFHFLKHPLFFAKTTYYGQNDSQMARYGPGVFEVIIWPRSKDTFGI